MSNRIKILLAEDDKNLGYILSEYLKMNGFQVELCINGCEALKLYNKVEFDICIFDVMMPEMDGFSLAKEIRKTDKQIPIIFLTAKTLKVDKLKGFSIGADDYVIKPVDEEELIARIRAVLKRTHFEKQLSKIDNATYQIGNYTFDYNNQSLQIEDLKKLLTSKEAEILKELCDSQGSILYRKNILKKLWGEQDYFTRKSMDVFIYKLRKYLSKDKNIEIKNVHGKGFILHINE